MPHAWVSEIKIRVRSAYVIIHVFEMKGAVLQGSLAHPEPCKGSGLVFCREAPAVYQIYPEAPDKVRSPLKASGQPFFRQRGRNPKVRWGHPLGIYNIKRDVIRTGLSQFRSICRRRPKFQHCTEAPGPNGASQNPSEGVCRKSNLFNHGG